MHSPTLLELARPHRVQPSSASRYASLLATGGVPELTTDCVTNTSIVYAFQGDAIIKDMHKVVKALLRCRRFCCAPICLRRASQADARARGWIGGGWGEKRGASAGGGRKRLATAVCSRRLYRAASSQVKSFLTDQAEIYKVQHEKSVDYGPGVTPPNEEELAQEKAERDAKAAKKKRQAQRQEKKKAAKEAKKAKKEARKAAKAQAAACAAGDEEACAAVAAAAAADAKEEATGAAEDAADEATEEAAGVSVVGEL